MNQTSTGTLHLSMPEKPWCLVNRAMSRTAHCEPASFPQLPRGKHLGPLEKHLSIGIITTKHSPSTNREPAHRSLSHPARGTSPWIRAGKIWGYTLARAATPRPPVMGRVMRQQSGTLLMCNVCATFPSPSACLLGGVSILSSYRLLLVLFFPSSHYLSSHHYLSFPILFPSYSAEHCNAIDQLQTSNGPQPSSTVRTDG